MKNIGLLIQALEIGGAEKQCLLLAKNLMNRYNVYLFVQRTYPKEIRHIQFIEKENINYTQLSGNLLVRIHQLKKEIREKKIDLIFAYLTTDNFLASIIKKLDKNIIVVGGIRNCLLPDFKMIVTKILHNHFMDFTIFNNFSGKESFVKKGYSKKKSYVIHNCFEHVPISNRKKKNNEIIILTVGRFVEQKNYITALKSVKKIKELLPEKHIKYRIIGHGELENFIREFIKENQMDYVEIILNPDNLLEFYSLSDIYLSTSIFEGLSNTLMEALSASLPIVATDVGDNKYLVKDRENGFLTKVSDVNTISEKLKILIENKNLRLDFGKKGRIHLETNFSEKIFAEKYIDFIENNLNN